MFHYEVKFLTCDVSLQLKNADFKSYKYETKKRAEESVCDAGKRSYYERRGGNWRVPRPRQIRRLESKLNDRNVVSCNWTEDNLITIVFSTGALAYISLKLDTLDILQILFDSYCVGKLSGQTVTSAVLCKSHILFTHADRNATLISYGKFSISHLPIQISDKDPHLQSIELGGGGRRAEKKVSWHENSVGVRVLVWSATIAEPAPWSPVHEDLANLHLYQIQGQQVTLIAFHQLENETLTAELSHKYDCIIHIVEQAACHKTGVSLDWLRYEVPTFDGKNKKLSVPRDRSHVGLPAPVRVIRRSPCDARLLAACIDGSVHVIHHAAGLTHSTRAGFIATDVLWCGELVVAAEEGGRLQCFDRALSLLHHHARCLDLNSYSRDTRRLQVLATKCVKDGPLFLTTFAGGPLALLRIRHPRLLTAWIRAGRSTNALSLLRALDWETDGAEGLWAVNRLVCDALRTGLQLTGESTAQLALGAYLAPSAPHSPQAQRFAPPIHDLARKFFHHLLRRGRIEKALNLAVDLADWDLFADARWAAARRGLNQLADEAASLAAQYATRDSECSDSCSQCSSHCYSSENTSVSSEARTKPPPLPRLPTKIQVPLPTIMPVTLQTEPTSTNSIRPLHQYLDRDNTIWNTAVRNETPTRHGDVKPTLSSNRWSSDDVLNHNQFNLGRNVAGSSHSIVDSMSRSQDDRSANYVRSYQTELSEELPNTLYRYQNAFLPSTSMGQFRRDDAMDRNNRLTEKNKVKFSDTITIAVLAEPPVRCPSPSRELADSLPLCPPHKYLTAFTPQTPPSGTTLDYVEV